MHGLMCNSFKLCLVPKKYKGKCKGNKRKKGMKEKTKENNNKFKINKLFLYDTSNLFDLFSLFNIKIK